MDCKLMYIKNYSFCTLNLLVDNLEARKILKGLSQRINKSILGACIVYSAL